MNRCINIDWLEVYALADEFSELRDAAYFRRQGLTVEERPYGTRTYGQMFTIMDSHERPFIEVRRQPLSTHDKNEGLFPKNACHLRLSNYYCYSDKPIQHLRDFMVIHNYTIVKITRIDLALDFETFDRGDRPDKFIKRYLEGTYSKLFQTNLNAHGVDTWGGREFNSLSWGAKGSMISTKIYCKSVELKQVKDKPYIRYSWYLNGLIDDPINNTKHDKEGNIYTPDIYRIEFSIRATARKWFVMKDTSSKKAKDIYMYHTLDMYDRPDKLMNVFASLTMHYFHFKHFEDGKRKDRCKDKELFKFQYIDQYVMPDRGIAQKPADTLYGRLRKALDIYATRTYNQDVLSAIQTILKELDQTQLNTFIAGDLTTEDIILLQQLIAQRTRGIKDNNFTEQINRIKHQITEQKAFF